MNSQVHLQDSEGSKSEVTTASSKSEMDSLITAYTSPLPSHILTDYEKKSKNKKTMIEQSELKGPVYREFTIHIFQSINFLQNLQFYEENDVTSR